MSDKENKALRPRDASSLIVYRPRRGGFDVLMGRRHGNHVFMPHRLVFPGGAVERADGRVKPATALKPLVEKHLTRTLTLHRARALAAAAIRETFEETGLLIASPLRDIPKQPLPTWQGFYDQHLGPALHALDYFFRAVTPPGRVRRFDARFFLCNAEYLQGEIAGDGELLDIGWYDLAKTKNDKNVHGITSFVLAEAETVLKNPGLLQDRGPRHSRHRYGKRLVTVEGE